MVWVVRREVSGSNRVVWVVRRRGRGTVFRGGEEGGVGVGRCGRCSGSGWGCALPLMGYSREICVRFQVYYTCAADSSMYL